LPDFKNFAIPQVENGESIIFWHDKWANQVLAIQAPEFFSFAKNKMISIRKAFDHDDFADLFQLPLSQFAFQQMQGIQQLIEDRSLFDSYDNWGYIWGSNNFASTKVYKLLLGHQEVHPVLKWLWRSRCQPKHRVFFWLLINDRLSTRNILRRKHMHLDAYDCSHLCSLYQPGRRNSNPSFCGLSFCKDVLGLHSY
jgi:hypothetical protein